MSNQYNEKFFRAIDLGSYLSAKTILSILSKYSSFKNILDVGCGAGSWLRAANEVLSVDLEKSVGVDGTYTKHAHTGLDAKFVYQDLSKPLGALGSFDLVVCVEVAEHLPEYRASDFVKEICSFGNAIIFSAAIPGQGGTGHINEQWPDYWIKKFDDNGFSVYDIFRKKIWENKEVAPWYAQNCFLYARKGDPLVAKIMAAGDDVAGLPLRVIHSGIFHLAACESAGARRLIKALPGRIYASLSNRLRS